VLHTNFKADNLGRLNSSLSLGEGWGEVLSAKRKSLFINNLKLVT
jgi:hypothetical protein